MREKILFRVLPHTNHWQNRYFRHVARLSFVAIVPVDRKMVR